jgi:glutathione S-transferase
MLTLYGDALWESPFVCSVFVVLREKGLPFEMKLLDLGKGENRKPPFAERSITAKVPALDHDGLWLSESRALVEYLEERFPAPEYPAVLPSTIEDRARARQLLSWLHSGIENLRRERPTSSIFHEPVRTPLGVGARAEAEVLCRITERFLPADRATLFSQWTVCDVDLPIAIHRLLASGDPVPAPVRAYAETAWRRPSVRAYVDQKRPARS